jgi:hypothetical protein
VPDQKFLLKAHCFDGIFCFNELSTHDTRVEYLLESNGEFKAVPVTAVASNYFILT